MIASTAARPGSGTTTSACTLHAQVQAQFEPDRIGLEALAPHVAAGIAAHVVDRGDQPRPGDIAAERSIDAAIVQVPHVEQ